MTQSRLGRPKDSVRDHLEALGTSTRLTTYFRQRREPGAVDATPDEVIQALRRANIRCVLLGTHGLGGYCDEPRATQAVDVLVAKKNVRKAVSTLHTRYPTLLVRDTPMVSRFFDPVTGKRTIDVYKPIIPVLQAVFRESRRAGKAHWFPNLEMALVGKFASMMSPERELAKKYLDAGDMFNAFEEHRDELDREKLARLLEKVYPSASATFERMVNDFDAGRWIKFER